MLLFLYILLLFLILRFTVTLFNYISNPRLTAAPRRYHEPLTVFILPGNNDPGMLINSLESQDYRDYELVNLSARNSKPDFKNKSSYFLFLDGQTEAEPGLINNAIHRMRTGGLSLLSIFPNRQMPRLADRIAAPLIHYILLTLVPLRLIRLLPFHGFSAASGQFLMVNAADFHAWSWQKLVAANERDHTRVMKVAKASGLKAEALLGNGYLTIHPFRDWKDAFLTLSILPLAPFQKNASGFFLYLLWLIPGPLFIYYYLNDALFVFALILIALTRVLVSLSSGEHVLLNVLLHPFQMIYLLAASAARFVKQFRNFALRLFSRKSHTP